MTLFASIQEYGDICANRHLGNDRSVEANTRVDKRTQSERILAALKLGPATGQELADVLGINYHKCSGRFKKLREHGFIEFTGVQRDHANEYRLRAK